MISILIPVFNEELILQKNIEKLSDYLQVKLTDFEIHIVDNGSTDKTRQISLELQKSYPWIHYHHLSEKSVGKAFATGVRAAKYPYVISLDADLSVDLVFIDYAISLLKYSHMVVGSKMMGRQKRSFIRTLGSQFYLFITQVFFKMTITDFSMGAKAYQREAVLPILDEIDPWTSYVFEICVWLSKNQKTIVQVGVECEDLRPSQFNLLHEGLYRFWNLYRVWRELQNSESWFNKRSSL